MGEAGLVLIVAVGDVTAVQDSLIELARRGATIRIADNPEAAARWLVPHERTDSRLALGQMVIDLDCLRVTCDGQPVVLTGSEIRLLALLGSAPGRVFSFAEITEAVWRYPYVGDSTALRSAVKRIRRKLVSTESGIEVESVRGAGYRLIEPLPH